MFNKYNIFDRLTPYYLVLGLVLLGFVFAKIFKPSINFEKTTKVFLVLFSIGFLIHTFGLALRWYVSGHAPWSNGYESMIYIAWAIVLSGMIFSKTISISFSNYCNLKWCDFICCSFILVRASNYYINSCT